LFLSLATRSAWATPVDDFANRTDFSVSTFSYQLDLPFGMGTTPIGPVTGVCVAKPDTAHPLNINLDFDDLGLPGTSLVIPFTGHMTDDGQTIQWTIDQDFNQPATYNGTNFTIKHITGTLTGRLTPLTTPAAGACTTGDYIDDLTFVGGDAQNHVTVHIAVGSLRGDIVAHGVSFDGLAGALPPGALPPATLAGFTVTPQLVCSSGPHTLTGKISLSESPTSDYAIDLATFNSYVEPTRFHFDFPAGSRPVQNVEINVDPSFTGSATIGAFPENGDPAIYQTVTRGVGLQCLHIANPSYQTWIPFPQCEACTFSVINDGDDLLGSNNGSAVRLLSGEKELEEFGLTLSGETYGSQLSLYGEVAGTTWDAQGNMSGFTYGSASPDASSTLNVVPGASFNGINSSGEAVGYTLNTKGQMSAEALINGKLSPITVAATQSLATVVNHSGDVAGNAINASGNYVAFRTQQGKSQWLGDLGGGSSYAYGMNASGQVVGTSINAKGTWLAFSTDASGKLSQIPTPAGTTYAYASAINDEGEVVGAYQDASGSHAFAYAPQIGLVNLNSRIDPKSGLAALEALSVNNVGEILVYGTLNGAVTYQVLKP
jgi:probable HAF family extracellular repeat protein